METEELMKKLGGNVEQLADKLTELRAELESEIKTRADEGKSNEELKERLDKLETLTTALNDSTDKLTRQFGGEQELKTRVDPAYHNPARGRRFPNQRAAADFATFVGAALYRDSECLERCEQRGIPVTYERGDGRMVDVLKTRDHQVGSDKEGGYAVTPDAMSIIWDVADEYGMYNDALVVPMTSLEKPILMPDDGVEMYFVDELEAAMKSGLTFAKAVLKAKKVGGYAIWSSEFAEDVAAFTGEQLATLFGRAMARKIDSCLFAGDGTKPFGGIIGVINNPDVPLIAQPATKTSINDATADDFLALKYAVPARIRKLKSECAYRIHPDVFHVLEGLKDGQGRYILSDAKEDAERKLFGYPVKEVESYPDLGEDAAAKPYASFGAIGRSYVVGIRRALRLKRASELMALQDAEMLIAWGRFDVQAFRAANMANLQTAAA
jgi:HK97 family phage major capsid protein